MSTFEFVISTLAGSFCVLLGMVGYALINRGRR